MTNNMKLYQATLETVPNNCYVETVLVIAENEENAHKQLIEKNGQWGVTYTKPLKEIDKSIERVLKQHKFLKD